MTLNNMENTVTLSLEKYNEFVEKLKELDAFKTSDTATIYYRYGGGYPVYKTNDDAVAKIIDDLKKSYEKVSEKTDLNYILKDKTKKLIDNLLKFKSIFGFCIIKRKTIENLTKEFNEEK